MDTYSTPIIHDGINKLKELCSISFLKLVNFNNPWEVIGTEMTNLADKINDCLKMPMYTTFTLG